jgi:hypothetical protein
MAERAAAVVDVCGADSDAATKSKVHRCKIQDWVEAGLD